MPATIPSVIQLLGDAFSILVMGSDRQITGLTCSGKPEVPLLELQRKGVQVVVLHTGQGGAVSMCKKLQQTSPTLVQEKVTPSQTATRLVANLRGAESPRKPD